MLKEEAQWVGKALEGLDPQALSPLLNVGSSTAEFRQVVQPWITEEIFHPLGRRGIAVDHLDMKDGEGIDLHGDLTDGEFVTAIGKRNYRSLLCCNLLEHVSDPARIAASLERLISAGGYLVITVPHEFPYHPDPVDTMFRPSPAEIAQLFRGCRMISGEILDCGLGWDYVERNPVRLLSKVARRIVGRKELGGIRGTTSFAPWLFRTFRQSCAVLQRLS